MKKFLSITIVAVMLLSTLMLTSCDAVMEMLQQYIPGLAPEVRYTVTEAEWNAAANMENYTVKGLSDLSSGTYKFTKDGYYSNSDGQEKFYAFEGDTCYLLEKGANGMVATWAGSPKTHSIVKFWLSNLSLSELTYDEAKHAYVLSEEGEMLDVAVKMELEVRFENGVLVNITIKINDNILDYAISDIGTTVVDIPEYTKEEY